MFYAGIDMLFSILFPILFLVVVKTALLRCRTAFFRISEQQLLQSFFAAPSYSISGASSRENRKNAI